jgi:sugar/nucleoside kinase (ribokinase family)
MTMTKRPVARQKPASQKAEVVCFGMLIPSIVLVVDRLPERNTGELIRQAGETIEDDAAIIAWQLRYWSVRSGLIGTSLGDDSRGRDLARRLKEHGVLGKVRLSHTMASPYEVDISDVEGARTYFWQREPEVLDTLDTADLSLISGARIFYVDWYDGDHILRAMDEARGLGVPVYLNVEHGHVEPHVLNDFIPRSTICQATTDPAQVSGDPLEVASKLLEAGAQTAIVTLAAEGSLVVRGEDKLRVWAPKVRVVDSCGAGATYTAGFIYGQLQGWSLEETVRFATAAASIKCTLVGMRVSPVAEVRRLAENVRVERW